MQNNKKQIIYISTYDDIKNPYYGGGGAIAIHELAKRLSKNFDIRVLSWRYSRKKKEIIDTVCYERFGFSFLSPKIAMFAYQIFLPFVMISKEFDVWIESFCPPFTTAFLPLFTKKPVIGVVHMFAAEDMERKYKLPFHVIQNIGIKKYKNIIVTSEASQKNVKKINHFSNIKLISNGITKVYKPTRKKQKYVLFLGRIEVDQKGIDLLIDVFKQFHLNHQDYKLIIAGSGEQSEIDKAKKLIVGAKLSQNIILKGKVSGKTKDTLLKNAACIVITSRFETYSLVALEAMAYGAPIVCFSIEGLSWIPKDLALKIPAFDIHKLTKALSTVVSDKKFSHNMIREGNVYAKSYTWDLLVKQYDAYISEILNK